MASNVLASTLAPVYREGTRHYVKPKDLNIQGLEKLIKLLKEIDFSYATLAPCLHSMKYDSRKPPSVCYRNDCHKRRVTEIFQDKKLNVLMTTAIHFLNEIYNRARSHDGSEIEITYLYNFVEEYKFSFIQRCGHRISAYKICKLLDWSFIYINCLQSLETGMKFFGCYDCEDKSIYTKNKVTVPNFKLREVAEQMELLLKKTRVIHTEPVVIPKVLPQLSVTLQKSDHGTVSALIPQSSNPEPDTFVEDFDYANFDEESDPDSVRSFVERSKNDVQRIKDFCANVLKSDNFRLAHHVFLIAAAYAKDLQNNCGQTISKALSELLLQKLEDNLPKVVLGVNAKGVSAQVSQNIFYLRIAHETGLDCIYPSDYYEAAEKIVYTPFLIEVLTPSTYKNLEFLIERYTCLVDRLSSYSADQSRCIDAYDIFIKKDGVSYQVYSQSTEFNLEFLTSEYTTLLEHSWTTDRSKMTDPLVTKGFFLHRFHSGFIDNIVDGTVPFASYPLNLRVALSKKILSISDKPTIFDLKRLRLLPIFKQNFDFILSVHKHFASWLLRCISFAETPDNIPENIALFEELSLLVNRCGNMSEDDSQIEVDLKVIEFYLKSDSEVNFRRAVKLFSRLKLAPTLETKKAAVQILESAIKKQYKLSYSEEASLLEPILIHDDSAIFFKLIADCLGLLENDNQDPKTQETLLNKLLLFVANHAHKHVHAFDENYKIFIGKFQKVLFSFIGKLNNSQINHLITNFHQMMIKPALNISQTKVIVDTMKEWITGLFRVLGPDRLRLVRHGFHLVQQVTFLSKDFDKNFWALKGLLKQADEH